MSLWALGTIKENCLACLISIDLLEYFIRLEILLMAHRSFILAKTDFSFSPNTPKENHLLHLKKLLKKILSKVGQFMTSPPRFSPVN
jgi:hypothetical protein